ncbi:MAG: HAD-IA family hydrolase [Spirochaetaceae bacterium]|jgi:putative hydrolase of the HAD superfamily|nr:HAD-IA family hydrolase [Spirochaetaceae bacterium]
MAFEAVIFDLFFTLVDPFGGVSEEETEYTVLGMDRADFEVLNRYHYEVRGCGKIRDPHLMMAHILRGRQVPLELVRRAGDVRLERIRRALCGVAPARIAGLNHLRAGGYKTALVSNADAGDVYYWKESPLRVCFDEIVFSYDVKILKPDPRIYRLAAERLGVKPERCLFVSGGDPAELRGAREAGMFTGFTVEYGLYKGSLENLKKDADYVIEKIEHLEGMLLEIQDSALEEKSRSLALYTSAEPLESLNISLHAVNALVRSGITTVGKMMSLDKQTLKSIKLLGSKNVAEILFCQRRLKGAMKIASEDENMQYIRSWENLSLIDPIEALNLSVRSTNALKKVGIATVKNMLDVNVQSLQDINNLGKKSVEEILNRKDQVMNLLRYKDEHTAVNPDEKQERIEKLFYEFQKIPQERRSKSIRPYIEAYHGVGSKSLFDLYEDVLKPLACIADIPQVFDPVSVTNKRTNELLLILDVMASDLRGLVQDILRIIYANPKNARFLAILRQRHQGMTLQEIADQNGLTRERIRQLQSKGIDGFLKPMVNMTIDIFAFINAEYNGSYILTSRETYEYFKGLEHIEILLYVAQIESYASDFFTYEKHFDVFYHTEMIKNLDGIIQEVAKLPYIIESVQKDRFIAKISDELKLPAKLIAIEFSRIYTLSRKIYHRGALILEQVYDYILEAYYPQGIKLYDDASITAFRERVLEVCGSIDLPENNRAIDARLANVAILCGRGMYIHPTHIKIDDSLIEEIAYFIRNSNRDIFSINEVFEIFKTKLQTRSNIHNRYFLQGTLKEYLGRQFYFTRYTISKKEGTSLIEEIEEFIRMRGEVHKSEIFEEYAGITDIMISIRVNNSKNLINIGKGWYIHVNRLYIEKKDFKIKTILENCTQDIPVSSRKVLEILGLSHSDFLSRNNITNHEKLFSILRYMFEGLFIFSRPYIARLGTKDFSCIDVIKQHLKTHASITIPQLVELCGAQRLYFSSIRSLVKDMKDIFLRIDAKTLVQIEHELSEDVVIAIANNIMNRMTPPGYAAVSKIRDYTNYPDIGYPWNAFLLRGIVEKYLPGTIDIIDIYSTDTYTMNSIFVDPNLGPENHEALLRMILKTEHSKKPFKTIAGVLDWLQEQGLLLVNPPKFLQDNSIVRLDSLGNIQIIE